MTQGRVVILDLDRTICRFPATSRIYKRLFLTPPQARYLLWGGVMLGLMHVLWFLPPAVRLQRRIVMSLFARVDAERFRGCVDTVIGEVVEDWHQGVGRSLGALVEGADAVYIVSHCPQALGEGVAARLGFTGARTIPVRDYLAGVPCGVYDKAEAVADIRESYPCYEVFAFADDLVDLPLLRSADHATLLNGSAWSRLVCRLFFPAIQVDLEAVAA
jgi:phosphoserine phosphatase